MPAPRVSILVPTFNCAAYLPTALNSVFGQSYGDYEVLVVDDGSTDDTKAVVAPYGDRIRYAYHTNRGIGETRNVALGLARGQYVAFLDADDVWEPANLALKVAALDQLPDVGAVFGEFRTIEADGTLISSEGTATQFKVFERHGMHIHDVFENRATVDVAGRAVTVYRGRIFETLFLGNCILPTSLVMRRSAAMAAGPLLDMRTQEDYEYLLRFSQRHAFGFVPEPLVKYRRHPEQLTSFEHLESVLVAVLSIVDKYESTFSRDGRKNVFDARKASLCLTLGTVYIRQGRTEDARRAIAEGIKRAPTEWRGYLHYAMTLVPHFALKALRGW